MARISFFLFALLLAGCGSTAKPPILIGHVAPLRGVGQAAGHSAMQGVRLAVQEVNNLEGQKLDRPVVVLHVNASGEQACRGEAVRLQHINQVTALLGGQDAREVVGLDQVGLPVVSPAGLRTSEMSKLVFLTGLSPQQKGRALAGFLVSQQPGYLQPPALASLFTRPLSPGGLGPLLAASQLAVPSLPPARVVVLVDQRRQEFVQAAGAFAKSFPKNVADHLPGSTAPIVLLWNYDNDAQLADHLKNLAEEKPGALVVAGEAATVGKLRATPGAKGVPILFAGPEGSQAVLLSGPQAGEGIVLATAWVPDATAELNAPFQAAFQKVFGEAPDVHAALACDDARLLFEALRHTQENISTTPIQEKLAGLKDFPILTGTASFDETGQLNRPAFLIQLHQGQAVTVGRFDAK
jgi:ABC-type branched-subunit amino acid transport system substrate-binding protein